ncbi:uncharacterized protein LOC129291401 [Prosopis cineraria]|uniref:uncharacterized protein LOC129291401 n=1 Tax=Prosopis cineraria TaxID=364024 RepID=UPI0024100234|nr:uncharacterized protein LOC129291401 [Prosopis cineraria]XP_054784689.1 uncharacterized protein LOC129291401 [Prosopis cineraria]XP_054784690.1 uncharacterized protein LOC129291401 [Prosopis cineraria]
MPKTAFFDHNPLSINLLIWPKDSRIDKPFRFKAMWLSYKNFKDFLKTTWCLFDGLEENLHIFRKSVQSWNKEVFGMVEKRKKNIIARLNGIQNSPAYPYSRFLCELELFLQKKLDETLKMEEAKWFQNARTEWINSGDRNTRYYHLKTTMRRRKNKVLALKNEAGRLVEDEKELQDLISQYFKHPFLNDDSSKANLRTKVSFPALDNSISNRLAEIPSKEEIRKAIFSIGPYKASGFDGFAPIFFQSNWETIREAMCKFVTEVFQRKLKLIEANKTLISLILKRDKSNLLSHFRPISLCSVHYKYITKIITHRLKSCMDNLISPFQANFISGKHIQDNIIIGQEIMHFMRKSRRKQGFFVMKIDLEKNYDSIK